MYNIVVMVFMELMYMDYFTIESGKGDSDKNVLVIIDYFIRYV